MTFPLHSRHSRVTPQHRPYSSAAATDHRHTAADTLPHLIHSHSNLMLNAHEDDILHKMLGACPCWGDDPPVPLSEILEGDSVDLHR